MSYLPAVPLGDLTVLLHQQKYQSPNGPVIVNSTTVDSTVGLNLTFRIDYTTKSYLQSFSVVSPTSGQVYNTLTFDNAAKLAYIQIPGVAEEGEWIYTLTIGSSTTDYVSVIVTSKSKSNSGPITVDCYVPSGSDVPNAAIKPVRLVAVVKQGRNRLIGANVM